jgi:myosin heavy chain 9/10/11/14
MSLLDEECIMPKGSDQTFTSKVYDLWDGKSKQFKASRNRAEEFILTHYAADVEYSTEEWLSKNRDPLTDNITSLLSNSTDPHTASLFEDLSHSESSRRVKKGIFRTVAQRHKEQLSSLMTQLNSTQPHFVRCIIPNERKQPRVFNGPLVLDQLRCNGVLEGIRIARTGFPNRLSFTEFRQRYEVLMSGGLPKGFIESRNAAQMILASLDLDKSMYQLGRTKVFFRAGLLAELEEQRDRYMQNLFTLFQSSVRGYMQRRLARKRLYRHEAVGVLQQNLIALKSLQANPWWVLYTKMKPLLTASRAAEEEKAKKAAMAEMAAKIAEEVSHPQVPSDIEKTRTKA